MLSSTSYISKLFPPPPKQKKKQQQQQQQQHQRTNNNMQPDYYLFRVYITLQLSYILNKIIPEQIFMKKLDRALGPLKKQEERHLAVMYGGENEIEENVFYISIFTPTAVKSIVVRC